MKNRTDIQLTLAILSLPYKTLQWLYNYIKNRGVLLLIILPLIFQSCDKRHDYYNSINSTPVIEFRKFNTLDSYVKEFTDSTKKRNPVYELEVNLSDEEALTLRYSANIASDKIIMKNKNHFIITLDTTKIGTHTFTFKSIDSFGKEGQESAKIIVFKNLIPEAEFEIKNIGTLDPREYVIDASKSYDRDAKYGGKVVLYEYRIQQMGGNLFYSLSNHPSSSIKYIFPEKGTYTIGVGCIDDEGAVSSIDGYNLTVN
jgi:hypothetical protein